MEELIVKETFDLVKQDWITQSKLSEADFMREVGFALQHVKKSPYLQKCSTESILTSMVNLARVGLTLNPISKYAALIPRYNNGTGKLECVLDPMYQGLTKLLTDSGAVTSIQARVVYEGDKFEFDYGDPDGMVHTPHFLISQPKGKIRAVYSKAKLKDGSIHLEMMGFDEVMAIRDRSESYKAYVEKKIKTCIWVTDEGEMCRKTVIKRHYKYLPKSHENEKFEQAIELDNQVNGYREEIGFSMLQWIETSIQEATLTDDEKSKWIKKMSALKFEDEGLKLMRELEEYKPIVGLHRPPLSAKEANEATRRRTDIEDFKERDKSQDQ